MIYLDSGATSFPKPACVTNAVIRAMSTCGNPGRGGYPVAMEAGKVLLSCREQAGQLFGCQPEQVVFMANCTQGLNVAIHTLVKPGARVVVSGFEHNAVTRPLYGLGAEIIVAGRKLFDWDDTISAFENALKRGVDVAVFTHVSNVFGYILPVEEISALCRKYRVPFVIDAAQSAGYLPIQLESLGADFIAMPGHKGLLGPTGTGLLLCRLLPDPLILGGTGSVSLQQGMPDFLPDRAEAGTQNVPGIAGLGAGIAYVRRVGTERILQAQQKQVIRCVKGLRDMGLKVFAGTHQAGTVSFVPKCDCEVLADAMAQRGIAVRAGLHCAPYAHESGGTLDTGTVRISYGHNPAAQQTDMLLHEIKNCMTSM